jgi:glycosyltransferase involved in cell wall biosynthesis
MACPLHACTIVHRRRLPHAVVIARSFRAHEATGEVTLLVIDDPGAGERLAEPWLHVVTPSDIGVDDVALLAAVHDPDALPAALIPPLLRFVLASADAALYLEAGLRVTGPLEAMSGAIAEHEVVAIPYLTEPPIDDGRRPTATEVLEMGVLHRGVLGLRHGPLADAILDAWPTRIVDVDPHDPEGTVDVLQAWLDAVPATVGPVGVLRDPGYGLGSWNAAQRPLERRGAELTLCGRPLSLVDLRALDPHRPHVLAPRQDRVRLSEHPALADLCAEHARDLLDAGYDEAAALEPAFVSLSDGTRLDARLRRLFRQAAEDGALDAAPFTEDGTRAFYDWLNAPAGRGRAVGLTRYHEAIWADRIELRAAYRDLDGPDGPGYAGWLWVHGRDQVPLPDPLLPPRPAHVVQASAPPTDPPPWGVNVAGFFTSELGLGEAARLVIAGLDAREVPLLPVQGALAPPSRRAAEFSFASPDAAPFAINLICMNGDTIPVFAREVGPGFFAGRHTIALWWWELGDLPAAWRPAFDHLDEVWVGSEHIYRALAPSSPVPVVKVPLPVTVPELEPFARAELGLSDEAFVFLYVYDYHSTAARKNPVGHVEAFKRAFPEPGHGAALVLKCVNAHSAPEHHEEVLLAARDRPDITIIDRYVSAAEKDALIAACDCYLSLHRSEGFGLTPAEAMYLGRPVIATAYGGTLDFMTPANAYLVDYELVSVGEHAHPYPPDALWADPDLDQAARYMREVFGDRDEAARRGRRAAEDIRRTHSPATAGAAMERRLRAVHERLVERADAQRNRREPPSRRARLRARLARSLGRTRLLRGRRADGELRDELDALRARVRELEEEKVRANAGRAEALADRRRAGRQ